MDELRCRLIRDDGSEWRIRRVIREGAGLRVDAERVDGNGGAPRNGHLSGEPLGRGDRIEWTDGDGRVVWAMRVPLAAGEGPGFGHGARPRPGAA